MQVSQLIKNSDDLQKEADEVIKNSKVVTVLEKIGKVNFVGSYALKLLYRPDIDIFITSAKCSREIAISTTKHFLDSNLFQTVGFANYSDYRRSDTPPGYYWELIFIKGLRNWKFDIWYTAEKKIIAIYETQKILEKIAKDKKARGKILQLKNKLYDGEKYRENMKGFKIYEKVLGKI